MLNLSLIARWSRAFLLLPMAAHAVVLPHRDLPDGDLIGISTRSDFGTLFMELEFDDPSESVAMDPILEIPAEGASYESLTAVYGEAMDQHLYPEAVTIARRMVQSAALQGTDREKYARALGALGAALHHDRRHDLALDPLRASISLYRQHHGVLHPDLIGVHAYLGVAYQALGRHEEALAELSRSQSLTHRQQGTMNLDQLKLFDAKANSLVQMGQIWEAEQLYRAKIRVVQFNHGRNSLEALDPMLDLAQWLTDLGAFRPALSLYREALKLQRGEEGDDTPQMVPAMRGMARAFLLQQQYEVDRGLTLNRRIVALTEAHPNAFTLRERIRSHLELGDWYILFNREEKAWAQYHKAWVLAQEDTVHAEAWSALFSEPRMIYAGPPVSVDFMGYQVVGTPQWNDFEFRIRRDGQPSHVRIADSNMHKLTRRQSMKLMRMARFRPALENGQPIASEHYKMRRNYRTDPPADYGVVGIGGEVVSGARQSVVGSNAQGGGAATLPTSKE